MGKKKRLRIWLMICIAVAGFYCLRQLFVQYQLLAKVEDSLQSYLVEEGFSRVALYDDPEKSEVSLFPSSLLQYAAKEQTSDAPITVWKDASKKRVKTTSSAAKSSKAQASPKPTLVVFQNGCFDITRNNSAVKQADEKVTAVMNQKKSAAPKKKGSARSGGNTIAQNKKKIQELQKNKDRQYLLKNFYIVDSSTSIDPTVFQVKKMLQTKVAIKKEKKPQILIYHTHGASESFCDSRKGKKEDSIIGVGACLADILTKKYGYHVIHDETAYDMVDGRIDRNKAYTQSLHGVQTILRKNPSIQVVIDLHRDGVGNAVHRTTVIDGKKTAQVMFFNGLSRNKKGNIAYLENPNLEYNLAFSLQMKLQCMKDYADFAKPIYLKNYRYNLHLRSRSLLIELGNENNTLQEAKNSMLPLAKVLHEVLSGK